MGLDAGFLGLLGQKATLYRYTGQDAFGNNAYMAGAAIVCYLDSLTAAYPDAKTQEQKNASPVLSGTLIADNVGIKVADKILAPGGVVTTYVISVETTKDEAGNDLYQTAQVETNTRG